MGLDASLIPDAFVWSYCGCHVRAFGSYVLFSCILGMIYDLCFASFVAVAARPIYGLYFCPRSINYLLSACPGCP